MVALIARALSGTRPRIVVGVQNTISAQLSRPDTLKSRVLCRLIRYLYRWADQVVAVSRGVAEDLVDNLHLPPSLVRVICNPIASPDIPERSREPVDHPWLDDREVPVVVAVGRLTRQKNYPLLLQAIARARASRAVRLIVLGEGEERPLLESAADLLAAGHRTPVADQLLSL